MKAAGYEKRIKKDMKALGTYKPEFDKSIRTLAQIYEDMDAAREQFKDSGGNMVMEYTNKNGSANLIKNPYYQVIENLAARALAYGNELGLTPAGLKKIRAKEMAKEKESSSLEKALEKMLSDEG